MRRRIVVLTGVLVALALAGTVSLQARQGHGTRQEQGKAGVASADPLSGDWEGTTTLPDGPMSFTMTLKVEGRAVTGQVTNPEGTARIDEGTWDGDGKKLTISFTYVDGELVTMTGTLKETGELSGTLDYGEGQMTTDWTAKKKAK